MLICGPCLINDKKELDDAVKIAEEIKSFATHFRAKLWGGGTSIERWFPGIGSAGIKKLKYINDEIMPAGTEVQCGVHVTKCRALSYIWVGCRNIQNYQLLQSLITFFGNYFFKRNPGMTIEELIKYYELVKNLLRDDIQNIYIIERGINNIDRSEKSRWSININSVLKLKYDCPKIFNNLVVDCSHSAGDKRFVEDIYLAMKSIGVKHYMFEVTLDGKSQTDNDHMLSVDELKKILEVKI